MGIITGGLNLIFLYKVIKKFITPFDKTEAFKLGIIDERGKILKKKSKLVGSKEKDAYTMMDRFVWKLKRLLEKIPFGKSRLASYAAALWFLKEEHNFSKYDDDEKLLEESFMSFLETEWEQDAQFLKEQLEKDMEAKSYTEFTADYLTEDLLDEALKPVDKSVIDAFYYKKGRVAGTLLSTNGRSLEKHGMGGQTIAAWLKGKIAITAVSDVKSTEAILKYMKKSIPKGMFDTKSYKKFFEEIEDEAYGGTKKWKKGQNKMKNAGVKLHRKDRASGWVEEVEIEEGWKKGKYKVTDVKTGKVLGKFNSGGKAQKYVDDLFQKGDYEAISVELDEKTIVYTRGVELEEARRMSKNVSDYVKFAKAQRGIGPRPVLDVKDIEQWTHEIYKGIKAGWKSVSKSTLGGDHNVAIMIKVTVEPEKDWPNKILHNARYGMIRIATDGTMEMFASGHKVKNMRKTKIKTPRDIVSKINTWIKKIDEAVAEEKIQSFSNYIKTEEVEITEETKPKQMNDREKLKWFDKIKNGQTIKLWYDSSMAKGSAWREFKVGRKTKSAKYNLEKISMQMMKDGKAGGVKFFLYNRQGKVSMAWGDMGVTLISISEEVEEASTYRDRAKDDEKKKKRHFAFGGKKDKSRHGSGGYGKGYEEVEEEVAAHARVMAKKGDSAKEIKKMHPEITDDELENLIKESHEYPSDEYTEYMQNETPGEKVGKFKEWETAAEKGYVDEVAPPGWEKTVKKMKKNKEIDNPWALAWYMKNQGAKPQAEEVELQEGRPAISPDEEERRIGMQPGDKEKGQLKQKLQNIKWTETSIESYLRKKKVKYTEIISQDEDQRLDRGQFIIKLANGIVLDYNNRIARDDTLIRGNVKKINKKALKNYIDTYEPMYSRIQDIYGRGSGKEYMVVGFNPAVDIVAEEFLREAAPANKTGGNIEGPELPLRKKKKKVEMSKFAGKDVFMVDSKYFYNARLGKNRYTRYEKYVGNDAVGEAIRQFGRANPDKPIILANREDGSMMYLKYGRNNPSLSGQ